MTRIERLKQTLLNYEARIPKLVRECVELNEALLVSLNKQQLYQEGITSTGIEIASYQPYADTTKGFKLDAGEDPNTVTLNDTGDFYRGFYVIATETSFVITSSDPKMGDLVFKYGEEIFGLTQKNKEFFMKSYLQPYINKHLKLR